MNKDLAEVLHQALSCSMGLLLRTRHPDRLVNALHDTRRATGDPDIIRMQVRKVDLDGGQVAITKGSLPSSPPSTVGPEEMGL